MTEHIISEHQCPHWLIGRSATIDGDIDVWFCDKKSEQYCLWTEDEDGVYQTSCLHSFEIINGTPETNGIKYCPYCGNLIRQKAGEP